MAPPLTAEQLTGQADDHLIPWSTGAANPRLHPMAASALQDLSTAAHEAGFTLAIASGFRDYQRQAQIWNGKWDGSRPVTGGPLPVDEEQRLHAILRWSALPGTSRHHWGSDLDLYASNLLPNETKLQLEPWEYQEGGHQYPFWQWLQQHATKYQFFWPYDQDRGGVAPEPWHLSYAPVSVPALAALTPALVQKALARHPIAGQALVLSQLAELLRRYSYSLSAPS